ncbi:D-lactate dehydrogenase (cytochrome) [Amaricoccus macauensis]|uniref:D-lactate dehydrogenase (cytochrome) n=1 Tax=Amaricoccus macauensis TaxID=57001 RepID=A0A840SWR6_9RHOB|nr:FAD-linked oxidase C-terminal domain-containing protein [Amaricoccus macauensis]MBB5223683.1 D-lactate dehydrogenase (cytochrome) [Amaricoccus macauensis]
MTVAHAFSRTDLAPALAELRLLLGDRLTTALAVREQHGKDLTYHAGHAPDAVAFPRTTEEVAEIVRVCARAGVPIVPYGTGTSLEGHIAALEGGITVDLSGMARIIEVNDGDMDVRVEAGVTRKALNAHLRDLGLFFPIDPGADASIGGMAATRASGTNAVRYGTMRENVLGLTVVTPSGEVIRTGTRARKSSAGYDLTRLYVGSEGTLGIITEVQLRLHGVPEAISAAVASFETLEGAVDTVITTIQSGVPVSRIELLDALQMKAVNAYSKLDYPEQPTLFFEFIGTPAGVEEQARMVEEIADGFGAGVFRWSTRPEDRNRLWQARHDVLWATKMLRPGSEMKATDVCVPISRLAEAVLAARADAEAAGLTAPIVGHVGDGNFHLSFLVDVNDPGEMAAAEEVNDKVVMRALAMGGTCTGEHGVGSGKMRHLEAEHGPGIEVMRAIKRALDPLNIMNPGKIFRLDPSAPFPER